MRINIDNALLLEELASRFSALSDQTRLRILLRLQENECNVRTLSEALAVAQPSISKHLSVLERAGFVSVRRVGNQSIWGIADPTLPRLCELVCSTVLDQHRKRSEMIAALKHTARSAARLRVSPASQKGAASRKKERVRI